MREAASFIASQTRLAPAGAIPALVRQLQHAFQLWNGRRKLTKIAELDDHLLADIGISREDVRWALDLPFAYDPGLELQRRAMRNRIRRWCDDADRFGR